MAILNISPTDSDQNFESFIQSFMTVFDKHAPTKRVKNETQPDWHNENIKFASNQRACITMSETGPSTNIGEIKQDI